MFKFPSCVGGIKAIVDDLSKAFEVRFEAIETNMQELGNQLKDILISLNLKGGNSQVTTTHRPCQVAAYINPTPIHYHGRHNGYNGYKVKAEIPIFNGNLEVEVVLEWLNEAERFFEIMEVCKEYKVAIVTYKLEGGARTWWRCILVEYYRLRQPPIKDWIVMKELLQRQFFSRDCIDLVPIVLGMRARKLFGGCLY